METQSEQESGRESGCRAAGLSESGCAVLPSGTVSGCELGQGFDCLYAVESGCLCAVESGCLCVLSESESAQVNGSSGEESASGEESESSGEESESSGDGESESGNNGGEESESGNSGGEESESVNNDEESESASSGGEATWNVCEGNYAQCGQVHRKNSNLGCGEIQDDLQGNHEPSDSPNRS